MRVLEHGLGEVGKTENGNFLRKMNQGVPCNKMINRVSLKFKWLKVGIKNL